MDDVASVSPASGSALGLLAFLDYLGKRNEMVETTVGALRTGCKKVLDVEDELAEVDIRSVDIDDIVRRFRNRYRGSIKDRSLNSYEQRFRQSVDMYRKWLADEDWRPVRRKTGGAQVLTTERRTGSRKKGKAVGLPEETPVEAPEEVIGSGMVTYPFPLRPGVQARLLLPEDLTTKEAQRLGAFISALAFEERLAITAGPESSRSPDWHTE